MNLLTLGYFLGACFLISIVIDIIQDGVYFNYPMQKIILPVTLGISSIICFYFS